MVSSSAERRRARADRASAVFGSRSEAVLDALALLDLAWHDCYDEPAPPDEILGDIWTVADGDLGRLISAAHVAVIDFRDLRITAERRRNRV